MQCGFFCEGRLSVGVARAHRSRAWRLTLSSRDLVPAAAAMADATPSIEQTNPAVAGQPVRPRPWPRAPSRLARDARRKLAAALAASLLIHLIIGAAAADVEQPADTSITLAAN